MGHTFWPHHDTHTDLWIGQNWIGSNWIGQNWPNQDGQNGIGQSRSLPNKTACSATEVVVLMDIVARARLLPLLDLAANRHGRHFAHHALVHLRGELQAHRVATAGWRTSGDARRATLLWCVSVGTLNGGSHTRTRHSPKGTS